MGFLCLKSSLSFLSSYLTSSSFSLVCSLLFSSLFLHCLCHLLIPPCLYPSGLLWCQDQLWRQRWVPSEIRFCHGRHDWDRPHRDAGGQVGPQIYWTGRKHCLLWYGNQISEQTHTPTSSPISNPIQAQGFNASLKSHKWNARTQLKLSQSKGSPGSPPIHITSSFRRTPEGMLP